jgi:hypothetical protein
VKISSTPDPSPVKRTGEGGKGTWIEEKVINGCGPYLYLRWVEGGKRRSRYLGKKLTTNNTNNTNGNADGKRKHE